MKTKIYGAYGSNINLEQMAYRCPHAEVYKVGYINGYRLTFRSGGFANIEKSEGDRVPVLLWVITEQCEKTLIIVVMSRVVNPLYGRIRKITDRMVTITRQQLQGMRVIRAFISSRIFRWKLITAKIRLKRCSMLWTINTVKRCRHRQSIITEE